MPEPRPSASQRRKVVSRAFDCCEYCLTQGRYCSDPFAVEHVVPRSRGGNSRLPNLALSCHGCNGLKYTHIDGLDPATGLRAALFHPRQDRWDDHFRWNQDYDVIVGLTATGRATIELLQLNREGVLNLRRVRRAIGEHPPSRG